MFITIELGSLFLFGPVFPNIFHAEDHRYLLELLDICAEDPIKRAFEFSYCKIEIDDGCPLICVWFLGPDEVLGWKN